MSNIEKNYIDIPDLSCFDKNRVHEVKELNVNNSYLGIGIKNGSSYVYAIKSSPNYYSLQQQHKSDAYIYVRHNDNNSNQSYSFYRGYSYTYTEGLSANNQKTALIAYQFVNRTADNSITLYDIDTKLTHTALNGGTETAICHVNEKSDTSYFLRKENESNNIEIDNTSVKLGNIKNNLGNDTYTKFNTYCKYSALDPSDYVIHNDCEFDMNMGAYVWNLVDGYDINAHTYVGLSDTNILTAYAYIDCEDSLHSFFRSQSQIFDYDATHYKYIDFNYDNVNVSNQQWKLGTNGTSVSYVYDNNINYAQFYANAKHNLPSHATDSFENIINHPSYRNNYSIVDSYINIKGLSQPSGTEIIDISQNNYNTAKFIKRIDNLPVHMIDPDFILTIDVNGCMINATGNSEVYNIGGTIRINRISLSSSTTSDDRTVDILSNNGEIIFSIIGEAVQTGYNTHYNVNIDVNYSGVSWGTGVYDNRIEYTVNATEHYARIQIPFNVDNIYYLFENDLKLIKRIDILGSIDIQIVPSGTSINSANLQIPGDWEGVNDGNDGSMGQLHVHSNFSNGQTQQLWLSMNVSSTDDGKE